MADKRDIKEMMAIFQVTKPTQPMNIVQNGDGLTLQRGRGGGDDRLVTQHNCSSAQNQPMCVQLWIYEVHGLII